MPGLTKALNDRAFRTSDEQHLTLSFDVPRRKPLEVLLDESRRMSEKSNLSRS